MTKEDVEKLTKFLEGKDIKVRASTVSSLKARNGMTTQIMLTFPDGDTMTFNADDYHQSGFGKTHVKMI